MSEVCAVGLGLLTCLASPGLAWASRLGHAADCASQLPLHSTSVPPVSPQTSITIIPSLAQPVE